MNKSKLNASKVIIGSQTFCKFEKRNAMYKVATFLMKYFWGKPSDMADSLGVLLLTWNAAFYRYGSPDFDAIESVIHCNLAVLATYRNRDILSFSISEVNSIQCLFLEFLEALQIAEGNKKGNKSPVSVAKALHLLAPSFFPLWDKKIAKEYGCNYSESPEQKYIDFMKISKAQAKDIKGKINTKDKTLLKVIDEFNYAKFTKNWV